MIRGIILDVDGVLIGSKKGYNWPNPHPAVLKALKFLRSKGIIISLCTGKGAFAIKDIVNAAHLNNLHIGDGGAVVIDFIDNVVIDKFNLNKQLASEVIQKYLDAHIYLELYTLEGYYIQKDQVSDITNKHTDILNRSPTIKDSLIDVSPQLEIVKIMPIANDEKEKLKVIQLFEPFKNKLTIQWGVHPTALPYQFGIITLKGISKKHAAETISKKTEISFEHMLGVGDGMTDWNFMQLCKYIGVMGNASDELKKISKKKESFIGPSVDENGILSIFEHFRLI
jgi:HAD superfamily hydrolase (TIGR01484 family)